MGIEEEKEKQKIELSSNIAVEKTREKNKIFSEIRRIRESNKEKLNKIREKALNEMERISRDMTAKIEESQFISWKKIRLLEGELEKIDRRFSQKEKEEKEKIDDRFREIERQMR